MPRPPPPQILDLEPTAAALLDLLVELGHLDEGMLQAVNDQLLDLGRGQEAGQIQAIGLPDVKRITAGVIQDNLSETDPEYQRAMAREWPLLFH